MEIYRILALLLIFHVQASSLHKILIIPHGNLSHTLMLHAIGKELLNRGNEVSLLWNDEIILKDLDRYQYKKIYYSYPGSSNFTTDILTNAQEFFAEMARSPLSVIKKHFENRYSGRKNFYDMVLDGANLATHSILSNSNLMNRLKSENFSVAIMDAFHPISSYFLIPVNLSIPFVSVSESISSFDMRLPFIPFTNMYGPANDGKPGFIYRLKELLDFIGFLIVTRMTSLFPSPKIEEFGNYSKLSSFREIVEQSSLFLYMRDPFITGLYFPKLPHVEFIGGLTVSPPKNIENPELNKLIEESGDGIILCSFGSIISSIPKEIMENLLKAFSRLKQRVVFRFDSTYAKFKLENVPANVKLMDWVPQNDLLAHKNMKLFISHVGTNGVYEALYNGIPMLMYPKFQPIHKMIANRIVNLGCGEIFDFEENESKIYRLIEHLINNGSYKFQAQKIARILKQQKPPRIVAAEAIENVIEFGGAHLRPEISYRLNIFEFYMLDVLLVPFTFALIFIIFISWCLFKISKRFLIFLKKCNMKLKRD